MYYDCSYSNHTRSRSCPSAPSRVLHQRMGQHTVSPGLDTSYLDVPIKLESSVCVCVWHLPPGFSHFLACRYVSNILSLNNMYPIGSDNITSTSSGKSI